MAVASDDNSRLKDYAHPESLVCTDWWVEYPFDKVRNYDGSRTEWGNAVQVPIEVGAR